MTKIIPLEKASIDNFVAEANEIMTKSHEEWHKFVNSVKFTAELDHELDPKGQFYASNQLELWKIISGRKVYDPYNTEKNDHIVENASIQQIYPYSSRNSVESGNYLIGCGNILKKLNIPHGSRVVEFGVGYGNVSRMLSNFGFEVIATDIESRFFDLLDRFSLPGSTKIGKIHACFEETIFERDSVDAVIFFECFHHCLNHIELLDNITRWLRPNGRILFAAEAFYDDWFDWPWGIRLDGHAVWAIRNFGWMELGFRKSYINDLLNERGFQIEYSSIPEAGAYGEMLTATKRGIS